MLKIANREEEGWLREEDIKNIYIRDLYTIDQLWLTSSNEKFGFSIQKKIWMELCENRDVHIRSKLYDKYKIFKLFLKKVEWNEDNKKIKITFDLRAKEGHLPLGLYVKTSNNAKLHQKYERITESIIYPIYGYPNTQLIRNTDRYNFFLESVVICFSTFGSVIVLFVMLISQIPYLPSVMICLSLMLIYLGFYFSVFFKNDGQREQEWDMKYIALLSRKDL
ncbi:GUN4 domain-containing protein [Nostoc sp. C057]|uniref:GUN4 domain-containing protein n=1 Tax=Nostoc sp. C057 TaxID=2576903 RepID=UPI002119021B|nr:GUN4 domain-containing protein [Nostoc sp. C057]